MWLALNTTGAYHPHNMCGAFAQHVRSINTKHKKSNFYPRTSAFHHHLTSNTHHPTPHFNIKVCGFFKLSVPLQDKTIIDKTMQETRQNRISRLLQKELASIFQTQTRMMHGVLVSVTRVKVSPDLSICTAYLSIFPSEKGDEILKNINANEKTIRYDLGQRVHNQLRIIPELRFFIDDSLDYLERIDELLKK